MEVFLLKNNTKKLLCILLAIAAAVCVIFACFMLTKHKQTDSASSAAASVSQFGSVADFDYEAFDYSAGLDENGYWSGIKALDYVTLPEDFGSIALKENDLTPTEDELQQQVDNLLNQYTSSQPVTGRAAQSGDVANIDYTGRFRTAFIDPFSELPTLSMLCSFFNKDGEPLESSPEYTLHKASKAFSDVTGMQFEAMGELEDYVIADEEDLFPATDQRGYHESGPYAKFNQFRTQCMQYIAQAGVESHKQS